jgi:hypothetical protein
LHVVAPWRHACRARAFRPLPVAPRSNATQRRTRHAPLPHAPLLQSFEKLVAGVVEKGNVENESRELEVKSDQLAARYRPACLPACA